jgi:hypothetical protein
MKDGALDVYRLFPKRELKERHPFVFRSQRTGAGPSLEELKRGDYTHFPYERWRGATPPKKFGRIPILWDRAPQPDGTRLVAMASGTAEVMQEAKLQKLLETYGQLTLTYSKQGVSFTCPRRFRLTERPTMIFVNDPATGDMDVTIAVLGKQDAKFFAAVLEGLKAGVRVETIVEETEITEQIGDTEVPGKRIVYVRKGEKGKRVLRFVPFRDSYAVIVGSTLREDAVQHPKLQSILRSIKIEETPPAKKEAEKLD